MRGVRRRLVAGVALASMVIEALAHADGTGDEKAAAQVLFEQGRALVERGAFADACPKFAESQRLDPESERCCGSPTVWRTRG